MADWFAKLMQQGHAGERPAIAGGDSERAGVEDGPVARDARAARDARCDAIVRMLREREAQDREAREKRQRWYRQSLPGDAAAASAAPVSPVRLSRLRTRVPCRLTPEARALLDDLRKRYPGGTVGIVQGEGRRQALVLERGTGTPKQIGWVQHQVETDPRRCNVRDNGLTVETDGGAMLVLRFRYPATGVRVASGHDTPGYDADAETAHVHFSELRAALDLRPAERGASPRLVWMTRAEAETIAALQSRDFEAFYVRFKRELQAGIWSALSAVLAQSPTSRWHRGAHYTVVREPDVTTRRIHERTVDDAGRAADLGADRTYDAATATDVLLLYLEGDVLADLADIYFTLQGLDAAKAWALKEELFTVVRRFWGSAQSLASRFGCDVAAVVRMSQRAVPAPAQVPLLRQDWTNLRQSLVDRYGEGGRKAAGLGAPEAQRSRIAPPAWPFATYPVGEVNLGLRIVFRQEWRHLGVQRGEVLRTVPPSSGAPGTPAARRVETTFRPGEATRSLDEIVGDAVEATVAAMRWPRDPDGSVGTGVRALAARTDMGLESECREASRDTCTRLGEVVRTMVRRAREEPATATAIVPAPGGEAPADEEDATYVYSRLQHQYEVLTRPVELQNVVLVAEKLPAPAEIDTAWVRRHEAIFAKVLLDEAFRDVLDLIRDDADVPAARRDLFLEHVRTNVLHYQRAIWQHEDPQRRSMRYRKSGRTVPLEWRFELESAAALTLDELCDRLEGTTVDGQFAAYSTGRAAWLDEVIDPAGPVGFHGNYAVYHMRPELGSAELFSMLHFFKSPWLRANPETGEPVVDDPQQIRIAEDPAVQSASDPWHVAAERFRRERARRITLDTDGVVIDVVRRAAPDAEAPDDGAEARNAGDALEGFALVLDGARGLGTVYANGHRDAGAASALVGCAGERVPGLVAGAAGDVAQARDAERGILMRDDSAPGPSMLAGGGTADADAWTIVARRDAAPTLGAGGAIDASDAHGAAIVAAGEGARAHGLHVGHAPEDGAPLVVPGSTTAAGLVAIGGGATPGAQAWPVIVPGEGARASRLHAGVGTDAPPALPVPAAGSVFVARGDEERMSSLVGGNGPIHAEGKQMIIAPAVGATSLVAIAGVGGVGGLGGGGGAIAMTGAQDASISARGDGMALPGLGVGRTEAPEAERVFLARDGGDARLTAIAGGGTGQAQERAILALGEGERASRLRAGAGAGRAHERVIVVRNEEWLRPSLIAG